MTKQEFDSLFSFTQKGHVQVKLNWSAFTFWKDIKAPQSPNFSAGYTKGSHLKNKVLWYVHCFLTYSINSRALYNENLSLDDLFILCCMMHNEPIVLGRFVQWRL